MSTTPPGGGWVGLRPRRITPRRLGAAAVVYGVFVAGWYLGQPVTPECRSDQAAVDRPAEQYGHVPVSTPTPAPSTFPAPSHDEASVLARSTMAVTYTSYVVTCTNDMGERPRLQAWFEGDWK
ncbi:hypothetical protein NC239_36680 [Streptomyces sp. G3]|uniref:hypothetical protein n=1 Tax=unclassified Streptomyces TaxID=2593676 RepID=UPI000C9AA291|nr:MULTISPECIES: hypothetical protein [unclassified Streptomyces]MCM1943728.1 hypothetical protein [Streptomyces sp. G3]QUW92260.1 hypothetical protein KE639_03482 [Streptomyces sp. V17-9]WKX20143.1 hypothetical protein Q3Y68_19705 [Streptomyces sp. HUAS CX7]